MMIHQHHKKSRLGYSTFHSVFVVLVIILATTGQPCYAFQPSPTKLSKSNPIVTEQRTSNYPRAVLKPSATSKSILNMASGTNNKKKKNGDDDVSPIFWEDLGKKPGNLIFIPFIALFGIDLLLNIIFITKRSFEYFVLGQAPSTETWF